MNYFEKPGISSSFITYVSGIMHTKSKKKKFNPYSEASFIGNWVHALISGEQQEEDLVIIKTPELAGNEKLVWHDIMKGVDTYSAVSKYYHKRNVPKKVLEIEQKKQEYEHLIALNKDKTVIGLEKLKWSEKGSADIVILNTIKEAWFAIKTELDKLVDTSKVKLHFETEIYWSIDGAPCKAKIDCYYIDEEGIHLIDFKVTYGDIVEIIKQRHYIRQQCWYSKALEEKYKLPVVSNTILAYNKTTSSVEVFDMKKSDVEKAWEGGFYVPDMYSSDSFFLSKEQLEAISSNTSGLRLNDKYLALGIEEILEYIKQNKELQIWEEQQ